jgi:hypothetical protein
MEHLEKILLFSTGILFVIVAYKWLLRRLRKNDVIPNEFPYLFPIESQYLSAIAFLKYELPIPTHILITLLDSDNEVLEKISELDQKSGIHVFKIDTSLYPNGFYFIKVITSDQKIERRVEIKN